MDLIHRQGECGCLVCMDRCRLIDVGSAGAVVGVQGSQELIVVGLQVVHPVWTLLTYCVIGPIRA